MKKSAQRFTIFLSGFFENTRDFNLAKICALLTLFHLPSKNDFAFKIFFNELDSGFGFYIKIIPKHFIVIKYV
jgi:hypothetical protein